MRDISSLTLKDGNYNVEDVMKSIMDTYETRYNEIVKEHENGDREVSYELTGKRSLTLDEDLAGLDEAFKMRLANLEGYIICQQTNKAFENADSSWYFRRNSPQNEVKTQDKAQMITVGSSLNDYRADSWPVGYDSEFDIRSKNSFYKKTSNKKDRQKELLEEYLEKRAQVKKQQQEMLNEKIAKQEQERSRLLRSWNNERLLSKASNAYEANAMTEAVTDSAFSLG